MHAERSSSPTIINFDFSPRLPLSGTVRRIGCSQRNPSLQTHIRKMIAYFFGACMHCTNQFLFLHGLETEGLGQYALFISSILPNDPSKLLALVSDPHIDIDMTSTSGLPSKAVRRLSCCSGSAGFGTLTESVRGCHCPGRYCEIGLIPRYRNFSDTADMYYLPRSAVPCTMNLSKGTVVVESGTKLLTSSE